MNHYVPDFDTQMDYDGQNPVQLSRRSFAKNNGIMELFWQNGPLLDGESHRLCRIPLSLATNVTNNCVIPDHGEIGSFHGENYNINQHLFMQEDEMTSWLFDSINENAPINLQDFTTETLFHPSAGSSSRHVIPRSILVSEPFLQPPIPIAYRPSIPLARKQEQQVLNMVNEKHNNFTYYANHNNAMIAAIPESTVVDSCGMPVMTENTYASKTIISTAYTECVSMSTTGNAEVAAAYTGNAAVATYTRKAAIAAYTGYGYGSLTTAGKTVTSTGVKETLMKDIAMTSSNKSADLVQKKMVLDGKRTTGSTALVQRKLELDRKRTSGSADQVQIKLELDPKGKSREPDVPESEFLSKDEKKLVHGTTSSKKARAAAVHNLSERKRRDRINEKMKALQELVPRCNKSSDKASMLEDVIEYLKSLKLQVQMLQMGYGVVPMMFPGMQQYLPPAMRMRMSLGMEMGPNRPAMPFPNMLASPPLPTPSVGTSYGPRFPMPPLHMPHVPVPAAAPDSFQMQAENHSDNPLDSLGTLLPDQSHIPSQNFTDPYQQFLSPHQVQQFMQGMNQQDVNRPGSSGGQDNPEKY